MKKNELISLNYKARDGGRDLQNITPDERSAIIESYANSLVKNSKAIIEANNLDLELARKNSNLH